MTLALKIINGFLFALFLLSAAYVERRDPSSVIGSLLLVVLTLITFLGAGNPRSTLRKWALGLNVFFLACMCVSTLTVLAVSMGKDSMDVRAIWVILFVAAPFAFNVYALRKTKAVAEIEGGEIFPHDESRAGGAADFNGAAASTRSTAYPTSGNYFVRHWRGELSLPTSYWINGSLLGVAIFLLFRLVDEVVEDWNLRATAFMLLGLFLLLILITLWSIVGILRSAAQHPKRGGSSGWALTAQIVTVLGAVSFAGRLLTEIGPQMREIAAIAFNYDSLQPIEAVVATNGQSLVLRGTLGTGSYEGVRQILAAAPGVRTFVLDSIGGRLREAEQLAALVRERGLNTYVEGQCLSACTYVFIAGQDRAATPNAKIGFHRPSFAGTGSEELGLGEMLSYYRTAGISEPFLTRIRNTAADDMWYPTRDELIDNGVLNRISFGGEMASWGSKVRSRAELVLAFKSMPLMKAINERFPGTIDEAADAAWMAYEKGATDAEVAAAGRAVIGEVYPKLLMVADDAGLEGFLNLSIHQLSAARALGPEACGLFLGSKLDVTKVFPLELIQEEMKWGLTQLQAQPLERAAVTPRQFQMALEGLGKALDPSVLDVIVAPNDFVDQPKRLCDSMLTFYEAVAAQPQNPRSVLLRGIFQSGQ